MQQLYRITVPGLSLKSDFTAVRGRLLADFPAVIDVVATTAPATILVLYRGRDDADAWLAASADAATRRRASHRPTWQRRPLPDGTPNAA
jgi:hypothetical protein